MTHIQELMLVFAFWYCVGQLVSTILMAVL
jgi:hypothetical protein